MNRKWIGATVIAITIILAIIIGGPIMLGLFSPQSPPNGGNTGQTLSAYMREKQSNILAVQVLGNSTDIIYPELMDALFIPLVGGTWNVTAIFLNDTVMPPILYAEHFNATLTEVENINNAIYDGLDSTFPSSDSIGDLLFSIGFGIDVLYTDGTWIQVFTIQSPQGHVVFLNGTYTGTPNPSNPFDTNYIQRDENWLNGILLEPGTALNELITTMNEVFTNHL